MVKKLYEIIGISSIKELWKDSGRRHFAYNLLYVKIIDAIKGTDFGAGGRLKQEKIGISAERGNDYSATPNDLIKELRKLNITEQDSIIDMGCGKGLAMYYMSFFPFKRIGGIELSESLTASAKKNIKKLFHNKTKRFQIVNADAGKWDNYDKYDFFYIYNSFPKAVMVEVMDKISQSLEIRPRKIILLYLYPEFPREITKKGNFILVRKGNKKEIREGMHVYVNREFLHEHIFK